MSSERSGLEFVNAIVLLALANDASAFGGIFLIGLSQFLIPRTISYKLRSTFAIPCKAIVLGE